MNNLELKILNNKHKPIDSVEIDNQYAIFSTIKNDVIFNNKKNSNLIFCGGIIKDFMQNVYNFKKNEFVGYISYKQRQNFKISSNLIFKITDKNNYKLFAILPYGSFAMKILRKVNPKLGQNILLFGLNFFSILLLKLFTLSGANVSVIKNEEDSITYKKFENIKNHVINGFNEALNKFNNVKIDWLILFSAKNNIIKRFLTKITYKQKININELSMFDKGLNDPNYIRGIKYPHAYVRWDYSRNLKYFISLIEKKILNLSFLNILSHKVNYIEEIENFIRDLKKEALIVFILKS